MLALIEVASICISFGTVMDGTVVSITCISCSDVEILPELSETVHVTMVVPNSNDSGASLVMEEISVLSTESIIGNSSMLAV